MTPKTLVTANIKTLNTLINECEERRESSDDWVNGYDRGQLSTLKFAKDMLEDILYLLEEGEE